MYNRLEDKEEIKSFLEKDPYLHIYSIGDLDDFFWPFTTWYGSRRNQELEAIVMVYGGPELPTVLALSDDHDTMAELLTSIQNLLPEQFYAHLSPGLDTVLGRTFDLQSESAHYKMALLDSGAALAVDTSGVIRLSKEDLTALQDLYDYSYPGNWFDSRMMETNQYFGIRDGQQMISAAGIHVFSSQYKVAALGNIVTHPEYRNNGYGTQVTSALCKSLLHTDIDFRIGLNVKADNDAAIASYRHLGFKITALYNEFIIQRKCIA